MYEKRNRILIDTRAVIDPKAELAHDVSVGAYSIIGADVQIESGTWIGPHVVLKGPMKIGRNNKIYQFASLGENPQDKKYNGEPNTSVEIGNNNEIREYCTINRGTIQGGGITRIGDNNWIMAYCHIAHDCIVHNNTIFANGASLAGHVEIEDCVILGGFALIHQFCIMGIYSFAAPTSLIFKDVLPYVMVCGNRAEANGLNKEGLKRQGLSSDTIRALNQAYKIIYKQNMLKDQAIAALEELSTQYSEVRKMQQCLQNSKRGIVR